MGRVRIGVATVALALAGCGHRFPALEALLPESYGPPFGRGIVANLPHHPHIPGTSERHAEVDTEKNRNYSSHARCQIALRARLGSHAGASGPVAISAIEAVGHYEEAGVVHEYRCTDFILSHRAWHREGHGEGHGGPEANHH